MRCCVVKQNKMRKDRWINLLLAVGRPGLPCSRRAIGSKAPACLLFLSLSKSSRFHCFNKICPSHQPTSPSHQWMLNPSPCPSPSPSTEGKLNGALPPHLIEFKLTFRLFFEKLPWKNKNKISYELEILWTFKNAIISYGFITRS